MLDLNSIDLADVKSIGVLDEVSILDSNLIDVADVLSETISLTSFLIFPYSLEYGITMPLPGKI